MLIVYVILGVKSIFNKVTSWPQLISKFLVASACLHAASDWPRTFFTRKVFLFSITFTSCLLLAPFIFQIQDQSTRLQQVH